PGASERQVSHIKSLVIGGGGFLGGALVRLLCASGLRPSVMVRQPAEDGEDGRLFQGDVCDGESVRSVIRQANPSRVFHTASLTIV
ncbi:MAG: NAD-dependent epimerase/dehydratase family protein, partial [Nitrospira sp.]